VNHGRASGAEVRAKLGRVRYLTVAHHLVERGFAVFLPTRVGYGVTGGDPTLHPGRPCNEPAILTNNVPAWKAAVDEFLKPLGF
jgi:hypothetical protein